MVRRSHDAPRTVADWMRSTSTRVDELNRAKGRSVQALRSPAGHQLEMSPGGGNPLLIATGTNTDVDSGIEFARGALSVLSADGSEYRSLNAAVIRGESMRVGDSVSITNGAVDVGSGQLRAQGGQIFANGGTLSVTNGSVSVAGSTISGAGVQILIPGGVINTDSNGSVRSKDFYGGTFHGVLADSERRLKDELEPIKDGLKVVERLRPVRYRWTNPERDLAVGDQPRDHAGIYVDECPDEAVIEQKMPDPDTGQPVPSGTRTYDRDAVIAYLVSAVQTLSARVQELEGAA